MTRKQVTYNLIERYLDRQLTDVEQQEFLQRIQEDDSFAEEVFLLREVRKLAYQEDPAKIELLKELGDKHFIAQKTIKFSWRKLAVAATFTGLVCMLFFMAYGQFAKDELMAAELDLTEMSDSPSKLHLGEKYYNEGEFQQALEVFNAFLKTTPDRFEVMEAVGLCYLKMENHERAASTFIQILNSDAIFKYKDNARWYLALDAFNAKDAALCHKYLDEILANSRSLNLEKAMELKKRL